MVIAVRPFSSCGCYCYLFIVRISLGIPRDATVQHLNFFLFLYVSIVLPLQMIKVSYSCQCSNFFLCLPAAIKGQEVQSDQNAAIALSLEVLYVTLCAKIPLSWKFRTLNPQILKLKGKEDKFSKWVSGRDIEGDTTIYYTP